MHADLVDGETARQEASEAQHRGTPMRDSRPSWALIRVSEQIELESGGDRVDFQTGGPDP